MKCSRCAHRSRSLPAMMKHYRKEHAAALRAARSKSAPTGSSPSSTSSNRASRGSRSSSIEPHKLGGGHLAYLETDAGAVRCWCGYMHLIEV